KLWEDGLARRHERTDIFSTLKNSAQQFYKLIGDKTYLLAGYPWFGSRARDQFFSLLGCTLAINRMDYCDAIMKTSIEEIREFLNGNAVNIQLEEIDQPDVLLWFIAAVQQYATHTSIE